MKIKDCLRGRKKLTTEEMNYINSKFLFSVLKGEIFTLVEEEK